MRKPLIALALAAALAGQPTLLDQVWGFLTSIWGASDGGTIVTPQTDAGLGMDPDGKPGS